MLQRQGRARRLHTAAAADLTPPVYDYGVKSRVLTCDGHPGTVLAVAEGPYPGTESYDVRLDGGLGGGQYLAGQLQPLAVGHATGTAAADYPELAQVLVEHPDPARGTLARAAARQGGCTECGGDLGSSAFPSCSDCGSYSHHIRCCPRTESTPGMDDIVHGITGLHRGLQLRLPEDLHHFANEHEGDRSAQARSLIDHITRTGEDAHAHGLGLSWTDDEQFAKDYAYGRPGTTSVVLHAKPPEPEHVENDRATLAGYPGSVGPYKGADWPEIPLKRGAPVRLTGLSWRTDGDNGRWRHHDFADAPAVHQAVVIDHHEHTSTEQSWWSSYTDPDPGRSTGGFTSVASHIATRAAAVYSAAMASDDFNHQLQAARARNFHDRMRNYMNVNGGHNLPMPPDTGCEDHEPMASTCPDCGHTLHTDAASDTSGVTAPDGTSPALRFDTPCDPTGARRHPVGEQAYEPDDQPIENSIGPSCPGCGMPVGVDTAVHGCVMCGNGDHHSYCCPTLGSLHTASAEMSLGETIVPNRIPGPGPTKARSPMDNPASSGWASGPDPDQWSAAPLYPLDSRVGQTLTADGLESTLHDEPEAALPTTDGQINADDADPEALTPSSFTAVLAAMHAANPDLDPARAGARGGRGDGDIALAAQAHLAGLGKTGAYAFTPGQRRELIEEAPDAVAANADRLDLTGTHYADMQQMMGDDEEDDGTWLV